ncbi:MAG: peptidoglycan-binding protein [bacterium]|nr:MAG: peptidoglycan-binding protein [bacterium]
MGTIKHRIWAVSLCLLLGFLYSCSSDDGPDAYTQSLQDNASNLNMRGEPLQKTNPEDIARIQASLEYLGYNPGLADGTYNPKTRLAIKRFQKAHGLHTDGTAGALTEQAIYKAIQMRATLQDNTPSNIQPRKRSNP